MKEIIGLIIGVKLAVFVVIVISHIILPFNQEYYHANFIYPTGEKVNIFTSFKTWDAQHYLYLSEIGYKKNNVSNAFYPLYPFLISIVNSVIGNSLIAGLLISNILSFFMIILFYRLVSILFNKKIALISSIFFLSFPTAFYLNLVYTESLFLFLTLLFFNLLYEKRYFLSSLVAFLIPSARVVGIIIIVPMFVRIVTDKALKSASFKLPTFNKPLEFHIKYNYLLLIMPLLGFGAYLLFMHFSTGSALSGIKSGEYFVGRYSIGNLINPFGIFQNFFVTNLSLHNYNQSLIDRCFFIFYLALLPLIYKYLPKPFFWYSLIGLTPFLGSFMGYSRYVFAVFPLFIVLGVLSYKKWGFLLLPVLILFLSLQVVFVILYSLNFWVS